MSRRGEDVNPEAFRTGNAVPSAPPADEGVGPGGRAVAVDDKACLARRSAGRYFLPVSTFGGLLYDPLADAEHLAKFEFRAVPQDAYRLYVTFLTTENRAYLRQAQRAI